MPYPSFSKTSMPVIVFSRGDVFPVHTTLQFRQVRGVSDAGTARVAVLSAPVEMLPLRFEGLPLADYQALRAWLTDPAINGSAGTFTYTDRDGVPHTVRWWPPSDDNLFDMVQIAYGLYNVELTLRVEL